MSSQISKPNHISYLPSRSIRLGFILTCIIFLSSCNQNDNISPDINFFASVNEVSPLHASAGDTIVISGIGFDQRLSVSLDNCFINNSELLITNTQASFILPSCATSGTLGLWAACQSACPEFYLKVRENDVTPLSSLPDQIGSIEVFDFVNRETGVISDGTNTFKTVNGGENWEVASYNSITKLISVSSEETWGLTLNGDLLRSNRLGDLLSTVNIPGIRELIDFDVDDQNILALGHSMGDHTVLLKSVDSGNSWTEIANEQDIRELENHKIIFQDRNHIKLFHEYARRLASTRDQVSWSNIPISIIPLSTNPNPIFFLDPDIAWSTVAEEHLMVSENGGFAWDNHCSRPISLSSPEEFIRNVHFFDSNRGMAVTNIGGILRTTNGGSRWEIKHIDEQIIDASFSKDEESVIILTINSAGGQSLMHIPF